MAGERREITIGEHCYQPPRNAAHQELSHISTDPQGINWTVRIAQESYTPQADAGIFDSASLDFYGSLRRELGIINPAAAKEMRESMRLNGVGDPFIHPLLPDLSKTDKQIVVAAGRQSYMKEIGAAPRWFWPPETALDMETLEVLADNGYLGTLCAPEQIQLASGQGAQNIPTRITLSSGRSLLALPFDRSVSGPLAFEDKANADQFAQRHILPAIARLPGNLPLTAWTDGETFGHHAHFADKFLQYLLITSLPSMGVDVVSINDFPDRWDARSIQTGRLIERTAWSCPHGNLQRWHGDCGCSGLNGSWKGPFMSALSSFNRSVDAALLPHFSARAFSEKMANQFSQALYNPGGRKSSGELSILSAKASSLTALTSCGTFFDNPHTSGHINILFALQSIAHLRDAGLTTQAKGLEASLFMNLEKVPDPTRPGRNASDIMRQLLNR